ncbi:MAG: hypothetical protein HC855_13570 [Rhizobiales bacterium]|nr:hypothetical protein [Hyphomicrobiales bacterium]
MIWICTEAVEHAVHHHLVDQLAFLEKRDPELHRLISEIQVEELSHLDHAKSSRGTQAFSRAACCHSLPS